MSMKSTLISLLIYSAWSIRALTHSVADTLGSFPLPLWLIECRKSKILWSKKDLPTCFLFSYVEGVKYLNLQLKFLRFSRPNFHHFPSNEVLAFLLAYDKNRGGVTEGHPKRTLGCPLSICPLRCPLSMSPQYRPPAPGHIRTGNTNKFTIRSQ